MNDSNAKTMYETVPAAAELNKVPGFDPLKFLRRTKDTLKLDLPGMKSSSGIRFWARASVCTIRPMPSGPESRSRQLWKKN